jgi:hypothetical protein
MVAETLDLCAIAGVSADVARGFVQAQTPIAKVRSELMARQAKATDSVDIGTTPPVTSSTAGWDEAISKVNAQLGHAKKA